MTDQTPEPELTPEEIERLRARLAVSEAPTDVVDRARASALAAFEEVHGGGTPDAALRDIGVRDIASAGSARRQAWYQRVPLGAAAAIVAVVALVGAFSQIDLDSSDDDTASADFETTGDALGDSLLESQEGADDSSDGAAGLGGSGQGESAPAASDAGRAVFVYEDIDALVEDYRRRFDQTEDQTGGGGTEDLDETAAPTTSAAAEYRQSPCDAVGAAEVTPHRVVTQDSALLAPEGEQTWTLVVVYRSETNSLRVAVVDDASCELLEDRAL